ncbi:hypothetical protein HY994_05450 [Candidatus Micrarchaeota archaeon]|nr:hypothetical protein [Candidatus Micrarchaeota archaeon]
MDAQTAKPTVKTIKLLPHAREHAPFEGGHAQIVRNQNATGQAAGNTTDSTIYLFFEGSGAQHIPATIFPKTTFRPVRVDLEAARGFVASEPMPMEHAMESWQLDENEKNRARQALDSIGHKLR